MSIEIKPSHKGLLHKNLGVPQGQKLSAHELNVAANSHDPKVRERANFAIQAKKWNHK